MKTAIHKKRIILLLLVVIPQLLFAQPPPPPAQTGAPLDEGILFALIAGLAIAVKKMIGKNKKG